jgi:energy-coupling factor transporter ATP-binding protein EcfA2
LKIESVRIQNFRPIKDLTVPLGDYTCLVGPNGGGKSTILTALSIFFRYSTDAVTNLLALDEEDFHKRHTSEPIRITVTFSDLSVEAQADFANYYRQGKLTVSAVARWDPASRTAPVQQFGQRFAMAPFAPFFKAEGDGAKVDELRKLYAEIKLSYPSLPPPGTKVAMIEALRQYEDAHPAECTPLESGDQFYGFGAKGKNLLEKHLQWVFVPAVKDASSEQLEAKRTALGQILERTVRSKMSFDKPLQDLRDDAFKKYKELLESYDKSLEDLARSLTTKLRDWAHAGTRVRLWWQSDSSKVSVSEPVAEILAGEGVFEGHLPRFGHGFQRSFLLALLQELASGDTIKGPTLVLACEEPELYQHPPQIRHLTSVFGDLTSQGTQVIVCTHSPLLVRGEQFEEVRFVTRDPESGESVVKFQTFDSVGNTIAQAGGKKPLKPAGTALKVSQALQPTINEMFFTSILVLVEGLEDMAYISTYLVLTNLWQEFRRLGLHIVICHGKNSMTLPLAIANSFGIPTFVVFDADTDRCDEPDRKARHERENRILLNLCGLGKEPELPKDTIWSDTAVLWKENIGAAVAGDFGKAEWEELGNHVKAAHDIGDVADIHKSFSYIHWLLTDAWDGGKKSPTLERLCKAIVAFGRTRSAPGRAAAN